MPYLFLFLAIGAELIATSLLKTTEGFTRLLPTLGCLSLYGLSFFGLSHAVKDIPVGVAYAMWSGLGTAAIVGIGAVFLGEPLSVIKVIGVGLIIAGVLILNLSGAASH
ncbi:DMT family transporter [Rothia sp. P6271]|uniref:DMT family transporter n=1 Tax=unclassified Rothia (in: high G+C Gram-positive bacteria) TaxID=2689056 RepID=UPI003ACBA80A